MECKCVARADERTHFSKSSHHYKPHSGVDNANAQDRVSILSSMRPSYDPLDLDVPDSK